MGANIGYYTLIALNHNIHTLSFEPVRANLDLLLKNIQANQFTNCEIFPIALSDKVGVQKIYGAGTGASLIEGWANNSRDYFSFIPSNTLDNVLHDRLLKKRALFLVDIEGAEYFMLWGAQKQLSLDVSPTWIVEVCIDEHQPDGLKINPNLYQTFELFWSKGFNSYTFDDLQKISEQQIKKITETEVDPLKTHNFIFTKDLEVLELLRN